MQTEWQEPWATVDSEQMTASSFPTSPHPSASWLVTWVGIARSSQVSSLPALFLERDSCPVP